MHDFEVFHFSSFNGFPAVSTKVRSLHIALIEIMVVGGTKLFTNLSEFELIFKNYRPTAKNVHLNSGRNLDLNFVPDAIDGAQD